MLSDTPKTVSVSVVIPCYRCSATIERAVGSVVAQTARPTEVILIEDHSDDGTIDVLRALQAEHGKDWIKVIELPANGGPSVARNRGWDAATSAYVAFLDADDSWHPRKTELQYGAMVGNSLLDLTSTGCVVGELAAARDLFETEALPLTTRAMLLSNRCPMSTVLVRREANFRFEEGKHRSEDYLLWLRMVLSGLRLALLPAPLTNYHKPFFGAGGLSEDIWKMQRGQMGTYASLYRERLITAKELAFYETWSIMRFGRRAILVAARRLARKLGSA